MPAPARGGNFPWTTSFFDVPAAQVGPARAADSALAKAAGIGKHRATMRTLRFLRLFSLAAQAPANQGNLNVGGRKIVFKSVVAMRGKSYREGRIIVLATGQPVLADVVKR